MIAIVTTTIFPPSEAIHKFSKLGHKLYIVGDKKTPAHLYANIPNVRYLTPEYQEKEYRKLSDLIGWNCIQRRNVGFVEAYRDGAEIIAAVDDDNIPYPGWGENLMVGKTLPVECYENETGFFEPLSVTNISHMWHRGYPWEFINQRLANKKLGKVPTKVLVQADLWNGNPDIDAMPRLIYKDPVVEIEGEFPYTFKGISIFNSQNTFLHRSVMPLYSVLAHADRMDDIWGSIVLQRLLKTDGPSIVFNKPTVYQRRNVHDFVRDLEREVPGYRSTLSICEDWEKNLPEPCKRFFDCYQSHFK